MPDKRNINFNYTFYWNMELMLNGTIKLWVIKNVAGSGIGNQAKQNKIKVNRESSG